MHRALLLAVAALALAGCATPPQTAAEFRQGFGEKPESFVVDRPLTAVAETFRKRAPDCLDVQVSNGGRVYGTSKQTVVVTPGRAELHLQIHYGGQVAKEPDGGLYWLVADATPAGPAKTRIEVYRMFRSDDLFKAVKGWSSGQNLGCPDPKSWLP